MRSISERLACHGWSRPSACLLEFTVRFILPTTDVFLRCPSSLWKTPLRFDGLVRSLRRSFSVSPHRRLVYHGQSALRGVPSPACTDGLVDCANGLFDHAGVWVFTTGGCSRI